MTYQLSFVQEEVFHKEEGDVVEFKDITSKKPVKTIINHAEEYVLAFINAQVEGDLYLGIDNCGIIKGIILNRDDRDEICRDIPNKLRNTDPPVPHSYYQVNIHNVFSLEQKLIENLCVVQIYVTKTTERNLYRTSGGSIYLKKGSSCIKLNSDEITKEIERRTQVHLKKEADELDKKLKKDPNNRHILESRAKVAKLMNDVDTLDKIYRNLLALDPKNPEVSIKYAADHKSIGDLEGALAILNKAIELDVNEPSILKSKGVVLLSLDRQNEALQTYRDALRLNPDDYTIITQIGIILRQLGKHRESIHFLNYALSKAPKYRLAKYEKKRTYYEMFKGGYRY